MMAQCSVEGKDLVKRPQYVCMTDWLHMSTPMPMQN